MPIKWGNQNYGIGWWTAKNVHKMPNVNGSVIMLVESVFIGKRGSSVP